MANNSVSNPTFKPRRGSYSSMHNSNIVLEEGELFVETPDLGPGRGAMKMKMGDGVSDYDNLPYGLGDNTTTLTVDIVEDSSTTTAEALAKLTTGKTVGEYTGLFKKIDELEKSDLDTYKNSLDRSNKTSNVTADSSATAELAEANVVDGKKLSEHIGSLKQAATKNTGSIRTLEKLISNDANGVYITGDSTVTTNRDLKAKATTNINIGNNNSTGEDTKPDIAIGTGNTIRDYGSDSVGYNIFLGYNNKSYSYSENGSYNTVIGYNNQINNKDSGQYTKNVVIGNNNKTSKDESEKDIIIGNDNNISNMEDVGGSVLLGNSLEAKSSGSPNMSRNTVMIGSRIDLRTPTTGLYNMAIGQYIGYSMTGSTYASCNDFIALGFSIGTSINGTSGIYIGSDIDISDDYYHSATGYETTRNTIIGTEITVYERSTNNIIITSPNTYSSYIGDSNASTNSKYTYDSIILATQGVSYKDYMHKIAYIGIGSQPSSAISGSGTTAFMFACDGSSLMQVDSSGNLYLKGSLQSSSDATLKDIKDEPVPDVSSVKAVQFEWNEKANSLDNHAVHTGYIAQEVEAVAPQYVTTGDDGLKSLNYTELLVAKVDGLENKVSYLEKKLAELEAKLSEKENN